MYLNEEDCMVIKTKFQEIKEELDRNYYKTYNFNHQNDTYDNKFAALKKAVDDLLILLDKAIR